MVLHKSERAPRFPPGATRFLSALKRHNDREWFRAHRAEFDALLDAPMNALIERLAVDLRRVLPSAVASPRVSRYRMYRDTRFSENKAPLKTHVAAVFPCRPLPKNQGPGLYFEVAHGWVYAGGGLHMPAPDTLQRMREHIAQHHRTLSRIVNGRTFRRLFGEIEGDRLSGMPRGFPADHPAGELLKYRWIIAGREWPASFASSPRFYPELVRTFEALSPLIRFLNAPFAARAATQPGDPLASRRRVRA
ncbi:MAG TPA: DUF2461 domain-containing protein [Vicinamibacterales bacterium]|nr:DUF2461 domain-containing protein [Vicinamibacterales bacterium]